MSEQRAAANEVVRHLHNAIERVREDMKKVEFWADAVTGFAEPVPTYEPEDVNVWTPLEQARRISGDRRERKSMPEKSTSKRGG
jgi:hypothetical protein